MQEELGLGQPLIKYIKIPKENGTCSTWSFNYSQLQKPSETKTLEPSETKTLGVNIVNGVMGVTQSQRPVRLILEFRGEVKMLMEHLKDIYKNVCSTSPPNRIDGDVEKMSKLADKAILREINHHWDEGVLVQSSLVTPGQKKLNQAIAKSIEKIIEKGEENGEKVRRNYRMVVHFVDFLAISLLVAYVAGMATASNDTAHLNKNLHSQVDFLIIFPVIALVEVCWASWAFTRQSMEGELVGELVHRAQVHGGFRDVVGESSSSSLAMVGSLKVWAHANKKTPEDQDLEVVVEQ